MTPQMREMQRRYPARPQPSAVGRGLRSMGWGLLILLTLSMVPLIVVFPPAAIVIGVLVTLIASNTSV